MKATVGPRFDLARFLRQAVNELRLPQKAIATDRLRDDAQISRILRGEEPLSPKHVGDLSVDLQRAMCAAWAADLGLFIGERDRLVAVARVIIEYAEQEEAEAAAAIRERAEQAVAVRVRYKRSSDAGVAACL